MAQYYVDNRHPAASDANDGLTRDTPFLTIQQGVSSANAGDNVAVLPGTYREEVVQSTNGTAQNRITIKGMFSGLNRPIIKGSDVLTGWTLHAGTVWKKTYPIAPYNQNVRQVFYRDSSTIDAGRLIRKAAIPLAAGQFYTDDAAHTVYVWMPASDNPNNYTMECSIRRTWMYVNGNYVTVENFDMRHGASTAWTLGGGFGLVGQYGIARFNDISWHDFGGAGISGNYSVFSYNRVACCGNGNIGGGGWTVGTDRGRFLTIEENLSEYGNVDHWATGWHAGNKFTQLYSSTIRRNVFRFNEAPGVWLDNCHDNLIEENLSYGNVSGCGIMDEIGTGTTIKNNVCLYNIEHLNDFVISDDNAPGYLPDTEANKYNTSVDGSAAWPNGGRGIYLSSCEDDIVEHNTCIFNRGSGIAASGGYRDAGYYEDIPTEVSTRRNTIRSNVSALNDQGQLEVSLNNGTEYAGNVSDYNLVIGLGQQVSAGSTTLANWRTATSGQVGGSYDLNSIEGQPVVPNFLLHDYRLAAGNLGVAAGHDGFDMGVLVDLRSLYWIKRMLR